MPMGMAIHFLFHQARRVMKITCLRSSQLMKFIISCKQPPQRSVLNGSKLYRRPHGLGSEDTPEGPRSLLREAGGQAQSRTCPFCDSSTKKGPRVGRLFLNVTNRVPLDVHLHHLTCCTSIYLSVSPSCVAWVGYLASADLRASSGK
jgi:hypothetical protein